MELQDITADMGDAPADTSQPSDSQTDDQAVQDDVQPQEIESTPEATDEEGSEAITEDSQIEPVDGKKEEVPFFEQPGVKERIQGIEEKYGSKATYWDTIAEISQNDPEFRILMVQRLENAGKLPVGTADQMRQQIQQQQTQVQQEDQFLENLPPGVQEDIQAVRQFRAEQEEAKQRQRQEVESFFLDFEKDKSDINESPNPARTRSLIFGMAQEMVERDGVDFKEAMEKSYQVVMHPETIAESAREDGQVEAMVQANQEAASGITSGSGATGKPVKLTQEERRAAELIGMTPEEYRKYKDADTDDLFENI